MISWSRNAVTMLLLMWLMLSMHDWVNNATAGTIGAHSKVTVQIYNGLSNSKELTLSCKSKDDNLGVHTLKFNEFFGFKFRPNFLGTTLFFCRFQWTNNDHSTVVYNYDDDNLICRHCLDKVTDDQFCKYNYTTTKYEICKKW